MCWRSPMSRFIAALEYSARGPHVDAAALDALLAVPEPSGAS
jgi:hypothetical protein